MINFPWVICIPFCKVFRPYRDIIGHPLFISKKSLTSIVKLHSGSNLTANIKDKGRENLL